MIEYIKRIIIPYVDEKRNELKLESDHPALVMFDVFMFKGQCTEEDNNILYVLAPANRTDKLQPLYSDLSVNKPAKDFMKFKNLLI